MPLPITRAVLLGLSLSLVVTPATAQTETESTLAKRAALLQTQHPGVRLRVHNGQLQVRERATRTGVKWGAISGGVAGLLFGGFLGYFIDALCESECSGDVTHGLVIGAAAGAVSGALSGAVTGGIIGAAAPRWVNLMDNAQLNHAARNNIGGLSITPAYAHPGSGDGGSAGLRANYFFQTEHLALGPEMARYSLGSNVRTRAVVCTFGTPTTCTDTIPTRETVTHAGFNARLGTGASRRLEPYVTLGSGFYAWTRDQNLGSIELLGYSAGGGMVLRNANGRRALIAEARWQDNLSHADNPNAHYGFYTFALGGALAW